MAEASDAAKILRQSLVDAGCGPEAVRQCVALARGGRTTELVDVLSGYRRRLLDAVHQNERRIDCLDYLVCMIERQRGKTILGGISNGGDPDFDAGMG